MSKAKIEYTEEAIADLKGIFSHIAQESVVNALSYIDYVKILSVVRDKQKYTYVLN